MAKRRGDPGSSLARLVNAAKGLAHPARLRLLGMLATGELCVCQLTAVLALAPSTVSEHLAVLARGGLVAERKDGKLVFYRLEHDPASASLLAPVLAALADDPAVRADGAVIARLRTISVAALCAADLDLVSLGVRPPELKAVSPMPVGGGCNA